MMKTLKDSLRTLLLAALAGFCIGIGGIVYLMQENKLAGAFLFAVGLLTILIFKFNLFTGMVGYLGEQLLVKKWGYLITLLLVWLGNLLGTGLAALGVSLTRIGDVLSAKCALLSATKTADKW
ncbi:MAG: formate/nitrite transporter family protein [Clostridia bacterium]|nr:formate/nitrite transporter family protein [Clostridia bacterium]